jgi:hypothetical protein
MRRKSSSKRETRREVAWVTETLDPARCSCRDVLCCKETGHDAGQCSRTVAVKFWTFPSEYYCLECREYQVVRQ